MPGIFADRSTELVFNDYLPGVSCPWISVQRSADQMCQGASSIVSAMQRIAGVGWQLQSYMLDPGDKTTLSAAAPGYLSIAAGATVAPHHVEEPVFVKSSSTGVTYATGVADQGQPMIRVKVPAGTDWSGLVLTDDQTACPSPNVDEDPIAMDRVYSWPQAKINPGDALTFDVEVPASVLSARGTIANLYFAGPAGVDADGAASPAKVGTGHYCLKVRADGRAYLFELLKDGTTADNGTWKARYSFFWNTTSQPVPGSIVTITVVCRMWQDAQGNYLGDRITFMPSSMTAKGGASGLIEKLVDISTLAIRLSEKLEPVYNVPRLAQAVTLPWPVRFDIARDCRATFAASKHVYRPAGYLLDDWIAFEQPITAQENIVVYMQAIVPGGTSIAIELTDYLGNTLAHATALGVVNTPKGQTIYQSFVPTAGMRGVRIKASATSTDATRTPTIVGYEVDRSPVYDASNPLALVTVPNRSAGLALPRTTVDSVEITPQESDPGAENATFQVTDLTGELAFLVERNMVPIVCRTSSSDGVVDLFRGYVLTANATRFRFEANHVYPAPEATRYSLQCVGEWARASEALVPARKSWGVDVRTGTQFLVTDVIRYSALQIYPDTQVYVPNVDIPLLTEDESAYTQEPNTKQVDFMAEMCESYLGSYMIFDEAAGDKGMLRMLLQKHAPYNNLAIFDMRHPTTIAGDGVPRLPHWAGAYPSATAGAQEVKRTFVVGGTLNSHLEKAEGNCVTALGSAVGGDANASGVPNGGLISQTAVNVRSYNFLGLAPGSAGYPDGSSPEFYNRVVPIRVVDWKLGSQKALDWKTRRVFEKACFARFHLAFDAPLVTVFDTTDPIQVRPRRLRFYDAVQVVDPYGNASQFLVVSCTPTYRKDHVQMARYVLVTQSNIGTIGAIDRSASGLRAFQKAFGRTVGANWTYGPPISNQQKQGENVVAQILGLPSPTSLPIQDLDPASSTFGQFVDMADYDAIPHA